MGLYASFLVLEFKNGVQDRTGKMIYCLANGFGIGPYCAGKILKAVGAAGGVVSEDALLRLM